MVDSKLKLVKAWLHKSRSDLESAIKLSSGADKHFDTAIYHCQQAAEKALKGFLTHHDIEFEKTHDLSELCEKALRVDPEIDALKEDATSLTPYASLYRYPGEDHGPSEKEFQEALSAAKKVVEAIRKKLP